MQYAGEGKSALWMGSPGMADQYVDRRIKQVIRKANGDKAVAQHLLQRLCEFDSELMKRMVSPYLPGIVARTLSPAPGKAARRKAGNGRPAIVRRRGDPLKHSPSADISDRALDAVVGQMAQQIGETRNPRGMTALVQPTEKPVCSTRHVKAVEALIKSYEER